MSDDQEVINSKINQFVGITDVDADIAISYLESVAWNFEYALERYHKTRFVKFDLKKRITSEDQNLSRIKEGKFGTMEGYDGKASTATDQTIVANTNVITITVATDHKSADLLLASNLNNDSSGAQENNEVNSLGSRRFKRHIYHKPSGQTVSTCFYDYDLELKTRKNRVTFNDSERRIISRNEIIEILKEHDEKKGIPSSFKSQSHIFDNDALHVKMVDHSHEKYIPTEPKKTVEESRNSSNSCATEIVDIEASTSVSSDNNNINKAANHVQVPLVPGAPTTSLRIKLLDGTKLNAKFNHTHTVGDIRRYIIAARPNYECSPFELKASYPPKILDKNSQTLVEAGILNSMIFLHAG